MMEGILEIERTREAKLEIDFITIALLVFFNFFVIVTEMHSSINLHLPIVLHKYKRSTLSSPLTQ